MNDSDKKPKWTWENVGLASLVEEHEKSPSFKPENPPPELVESTIESCMAEGKRREEVRHQERMGQSFLYRTYHNVANYLKRVF